MLSRIVEVLARGDAVTVVPVDKELTTQQDLLNVSQQRLIRLLDQGAIPFTKTGRHRRLRIEHVLAYKEQRDADREVALTELTQLSEEYGGYEPGASLPPSESALPQMRSRSLRKRRLPEAMLRHRR